MNKFMKLASRLASGLTLSILLIAGSSTVQAAEHPAQELVVGTVTDLLQLIRDDADKIKNNPAYLQEQLEERVVPHLDFETMTKRSIGKNWRKATEGEREELVREYKQFLLNTYAGAITEYKGGEVAFEAFRPEKKKNRAIVRSSFKQSGSASVPVVYKLWDNDGWKIWDIEVSQLSLVSNNRSFFSSEIDRNGIAGLIKLLKEKNGSS